MLSRILTLAVLVSPVLSSGCGCNDQGFAPLTWNDITDDYGKWLSMDVAPSGDPVIAYYNVTIGGLGFATGDVQTDGTARWKHEEVDGYADANGLDSGNVGQFASMKVGPDGTVWIAYYGQGALRVAHRVEGQWSWEVADAGSGMAPDCGQWASLDLDSQGRPVVAHYDAASGVLRVARQQDGSWSAETVWTGEPYSATLEDGTVVERDASVGMYARLLIEGDTEYIAFYDAAFQNVHLLEGFPGAYTHTLVAEIPGADVGHWPSLYADGTTTAVAFEDRTNGDLLLATRDGGGSFSTQVVDDADYVGADTEIYKDGAALKILYFDGRYNDMKLATQGDAEWTVETLGGDDGAVGFFNETVTTRGTRYVASYDYTNRHLFFRPL
jgi:hypothetical protein